jgi:hypothetical protein
MSRNGSGTYTLPAGNPVVTATTISSAWANNTLTDIATALTGSLAADGQTTATGPLNMGTQKITNITAGTASTDVAAVSQVTSAVVITGGTINGATIGATTASTGKFTTLEATGTVSFTSTGAALMPSGTTGQQPVSPVNGMIRYNTTNSSLESYIAGAWTTIGSATPTSGPTFSAYLASNQSVTLNTQTKVTIDTEEFDTGSCFNTTNNRFTPTQSGYYQISGTVYFAGTANTMLESRIYLYKNGSVFKNGTAYASGSSVATLFIQNVNTIMYFNGSTDYVELWASNTSTNPSFAGGSTLTYFNGSFIRA